MVTVPYAIKIGIIAFIENAVKTGSELRRTKNDKKFPTGTHCTKIK